MPRSLLVQWLWRVGRRGAAILLISGLQIMIGVGLLADPPDIFGSLLLINVLPAKVWGCLWVIAGLVAVPFAFARTGPDRFGYMALYLPPIIWGFSYALTSVLGMFPLGLVAGLRAAAVYGAYSALIVIISGMVGAKEVGD